MALLRRQRAFFAGSVAQLSRWPSTMVAAGALDDPPGSRGRL